jgi:CheY-like chemotaxis protein
VTGQGAGDAEGAAEARLLEALGAALERGAARAEPVAVLVAAASGDARGRARALEAARGELSPEGLVAPVGADRIALLLPGVGLAEARTRAARVAARCPGLSVGAIATDGAGAPDGPAALLAEAEAEALRGGGRRRILVVEDDPDFGEILEVFLRERGRYDVAVVRSAGEAVAAARARPPDAAVVDLVLPDADGVALLARLREAVPELPAIACSGRRPEDAAGAGFTAFHRKPFDLTVLLGDLERLLRRPAHP